MEKLTREQINKLSLEESHNLIESLQNDVLRKDNELKTMEKRSLSDGAKIDAVKEILSNLWCC